MRDFKGKIVVVTGAGSGMGRSYAQAFARLGAKLALNDFDAKALAETVDLVRPAVVFSKAFDVADNSEMEAFAADVKRELGNAHVVINNAGIGGAATPIWALARDKFDRTMRINFDGVVNGTHAFLPQLLEQDEAALVNVSSVMGLIGAPNATDYCASKFAVRGFTEALALELMHSPVCVHLVCPGGIKTNILKGSPIGDEFTKRYLKTSPNDVATRVIEAIRKKDPVVVIGHHSSLVHAVSRFAPPAVKNSILYREMTKPLLDTDDYRNGPRRR